MRVTSIGSDFAQIRDLYRTSPAAALHPGARTGEGEPGRATFDQKIRRIEIAPQISEHMVRIYREQLEATGSKEKAAEAVKNSDVFRSFLKRQDLDAVATSYAATAIIDKVIRS
jgi:hypothetical protein